eukprot:GHVT01065535.1.p1 GENE.GHVT01065535.1~~GHVT01065535.1.p1  ORF type:complete len:301 (+),score=0.38 GHVT01065535.1:660-1562(+)
MQYESQLSPNLSALDRRAVSEYLEYCMNGRTAFPGGFVGSQAEFLKHMRQRKKKSFKPPGVVVGEQFLDNGTRQSKVRTSPKIVGAVPPSELFQLRECRFSPDDSEFNSLHRRMEWFLHWFIESASPIDHDERWRVLLPYIVRHKSNIDIPMPSIKEAKENRIAARPSKSAAKKRGRSTDVEQNEMHGETDVESRHITWHLAGISTTYTFFTIGKDRRRISQFMVLPHMQGKGATFLFWDHFVQSLRWVSDQCHVWPISKAFRLIIACFGLEMSLYLCGNFGSIRNRRSHTGVYQHKGST